MALTQAEYTQKRRDHWDAVSIHTPPEARWSGQYHERLKQVFRSLALPGLRVIEIGCGRGDLLASLEPAGGVGVDFSSEMIAAAESKFPELTFVEADAHDLEFYEKFDVIVMSDLVNDVWDVQQVLTKARKLCHRDTRLILNSYSRLWELPLALTKRFELAAPTLYQNWLTVEDITNLLSLAGFDVIRGWNEVLFPLRAPVIEPFFNRFIVKLWPFRALGLTNFIMARPVVSGNAEAEEPVVSVIVPARNEEGHVAEIVERTPEMGGGTELIFVEGHSKDNTYTAIEKAIEENPERRLKLFRQTGEGKGDAVRLGFDQAEGEILMILDADLTVPPEDLPRFYEALISGKGDFINGVRLVYPMEDRAMRFLNLVGNKSFSLVFSWLLGQSIKDTLCGTKVLRKERYEMIAANRAYFGKIDPFGDFDLILGAARLNLKIVDLPIRYRERRYGETNIRRWSHGVLLLRMAAAAAFRLKFI